MAQQTTMSFPMTRQGIRNLDAVRKPVLPVSGGPAPTQRPGTNISLNEQWLTAGAGAALTVLGLVRGGVFGLVTAAVGGTLLYRGISGHCAVYQQLGIDHAEHDTTRERAYVG